MKNIILTFYSLFLGVICHAQQSNPLIDSVRNEFLILFQERFFGGELVTAFDQHFDSMAIKDSKYRYFYPYGCLLENKPSICSKSPYESSLDYLERLLKLRPNIITAKNTYFNKTDKRLKQLRSQLFTCQTVDITLNSEEYNPNTEIWQIHIQNNDFQHENFTVSKKVIRNDAKILFEQRNKLKIIGYLGLTHYSNYPKLLKIEVFEPESGKKLLIEAPEISKLVLFRKTGAFTVARHIKDVDFTGDGAFLAIMTDNLLGLYSFDMTTENEEQISNNSAGDILPQFENCLEVKTTNKIGSSEKIQFIAGTNFIATSTNIFDLENDKSISYNEWLSPPLENTELISEGKFASSTNAKYFSAIIRSRTALPKLNIYNTINGKLYQSTENISDIPVFSYDSKLIAYFSGNRNNKAINIFQLSPYSLIKEIKVQSKFNRCKFDSNNKHLLLWSDNYEEQGEVICINTETGNQVISLPLKVRDLALTSDSKMLIIGNDDDTYIYNFPEFTLKNNIGLGSKIIKISPDDLYFVLISKNKLENIDELRYLRLF